MIRWLIVYELNVGRNVKEMLPTLGALQTDGFCLFKWEKGDETAKVN